MTLVRTLQERIHHVRPISVDKDLGNLENSEISLVAGFAGHVSSEHWQLKLGESSSGVNQRDLDRALKGEGPLVTDRSTYEGIRIIKK